MGSEMTQDMKRKNMKIWIKVAIMLGLMFGIGYLPPFGNITPMGMKVLGAFIGTLFGWLTLDFIISSLVGLVVLGLFGYAGGVAGTMSAGFSDNTVVVMVFSFILVAGLNKVDLTGALAGWFLSRKFVEGRPYVLLAVLFVAAYVVGAINAFAAILLLWNVMYKIADKVGYQRRSTIMAYILTGIVFFAGNGQYIFPWKVGSIMFASPMTQMGIIVPQGQWYLTVIISQLAFLLFFVLMAFVLRLDLSAFRDKELFAEMRGQEWTTKQKWGLTFFAFMTVFLTLPEFLPTTDFVTKWKSWGLIGATVIVILAGYVITVDGERLFPNIADLCKEGMQWDVWLMIVATMPLSAALRSEDTGIISTAIGFVMNMIGDMNWILFTIVCAITLGLLTQVTHNIIIALVMFPPFLQICINMGGEPILWWFVNFWAIMAAYTTPAASGYAAILHGNSEWFSPRQTYGFGFSTLVVSWLGSFLILIPIYLLLF